MFYDITQEVITSTVRNALETFRDSMRKVEDSYNFLNGFSVSELVTLGFTQSDAQDIKTAVADAHEEVVMHTGGPVGGYTLPYSFNAAQNRVIGP